MLRIYSQTGRFLIFIFFLSSLNGFSQLPSGTWRAVLQINDSCELPFNFEAGKNSVVILNGEERINVSEITLSGDSVFIRMPVFDSEFRCILKGDSLKGFFYNHARLTKNVIPFHAEKNINYRFLPYDKSQMNSFSGRYHVIFDGEDEESKDAIGIFNLQGNKVTGTFLTTTGDYRYLEGNISGNKLYLSAFDGSHLFLFNAEIKKDSIINGNYYSGMHWHDTWHGKKDENYSLKSPESFTHVQKTDEKFYFSFPDENGNRVSLEDEKYKNKPVIIQILGTWCPNCLDETNFLTKWYDENKNSIEIIALDFEKIPNSETASKNIKRLKERLNINYTILFAGSSDKKLASETLPMLDRVFAYPTTIFLNRNKKVVSIHTGFSGPGTGKEFDEFKKYFEKTTERIKN